MTDSWIVLLPALLVLVCAALSHNVIISLILGIISASLLAFDFALIPALSNSISTVMSVLRDAGNIYLFLFLICLGIIIEIMTHIGGITAYTKKLRTLVTTRRSAESMPLLLSWLFFLDDFLNGLTIGAIMRPLTDKLRIPRIKLAYLINSVSSAMCLIVPATTWVAMILGQMESAGISDKLSDNPLIFADPLKTYVLTIPYLLYPIVIILAAWFVVQAGISFGLMHEQEVIAQETGNVFGGKSPRKAEGDFGKKEGSIAGFLLPIGSFLGMVILCMLYSGDAAILGGSLDLVPALKNADSTWSLFFASATTIALSLAVFIPQRLLSASEINQSIKNGFSTMKMSIVLLALAYTFSAILRNDLQAGTYLANLICGSLPLFILPVIVFAVATLTTAATGSSWGTIAILTPLTINTLAALALGENMIPLSEIPLFYPVFGALLAGSCAGAHFSPITDSTVMASTSTGSYHMDHVKSHISYALPVLIGTTVGFVLLGLLPSTQPLLSWGISMLSSIGISFGILMLCNVRKN